MSDIGTILNEIGGGLSSVVILALGWVSWKMWNRVNELYDQALIREKQHSQELIETIRTVDAVIEAAKAGV